MKASHEIVLKIQCHGAYGAIVASQYIAAASFVNHYATLLLEALNNPIFFSIKSNSWSATENILAMWTSSRRIIWPVPLASIAFQ